MKQGSKRQHLEVNTELDTRIKGRRNMRREAIPLNALSEVETGTFLLTLLTVLVKSWYTSLQ